MPENPTGLRLYREIAFVVLGAVGLVLGVLAERFDAPEALYWFGYGIAYAFAGWTGLRAGLSALRHRHIDIDLLMVLAALGALLIGAPFEGGLLLFLFALSNVLQHYAMGRSRQAIRALMELRPEEVHIRGTNEIRVVPAETVEPGTIYVVRPGDRLPLDGIVVEGQSELDQASLTGESRPVPRGPGEAVFAGTINGGGALDVRVTRRATESALARMIQLVEEAQEEKAETQRFLDRFEQPYALGVIGMTLLAIVLPQLWGEAFEPAFYRAMTLMVAASPCALIISTPAAVLSAIAAAARHGVLFKGGIYVEQVATLRTIAFDKTGTLTEGATRLTDLLPLNGYDEDSLLALAATVQAMSEHHLAAATVEAAQERGLVMRDASAFVATAGQGVMAIVDGISVRVGNRRYFEGRNADPWQEARAALERFEQDAKTAVLVTAQDSNDEQQPVGVLAFTDQLRPGAATVLTQLRALGIEHIAMITGDNVGVAERIAEEAGVDSVHAEALPERKVALVRALREQYGSVAFVGDGVNDAPALAAATVGIAMGGAGTDAALETADLVLMADDLSKLPYALDLSRRTRRTLGINLGIALAAIGIMVASILAVGLPLPLAVVGHEGSTVLVALNGLRLLGVRPSV